MGLYSTIRQDLSVNKGNSKGKAIVVTYRIARYFSQHKYLLVRIVGLPFIKFYHWIFIWLMGVEIPDRTIIGPGLQVWHGTALIINANSVIGSNVLLRHSTTIGNKGNDESCPIIGNNVDIGSNTVLIGNISIGDNVSIGAGSVVTKSIPSDSVAYGNPMKVISKTSRLI
ncbi:serine acetyltransferase [Pedobacter sp. GR22-6]|uniref:serine acetyltransferase n=1 Tax=Pedobacter sp. GR22-6 TaxID=3127957 RepID=UPI00307F317D